MVVQRKPRLLRGVRIFLVGVAAALLAVLVPPTASADTVYVDVLWIRCNDQSEPFSDEIRIWVNGEWRGGWNNVDRGNQDWYYSSFPPALLNIPFSGNVTINVMEEDGGDINLIGWVDVSESEVNQGEHEGYARQIDGDYTVRYQVHY